MQAKIVETFSWCPTSRLRGLTIDGLPGMFVVSMSNVELSIKNELARYTDPRNIKIVHFKPKKDPTDTTEKLVVDHIDYGPWAVINEAEVAAALRAAVL